MDPATVFLVYVVGVLSLWLLGTIVHPMLAAVARIGILLPVGRGVAALVISFVLVGGAGAARASIGPPTHRVVQMVDDRSAEGPGVNSVVHRPMMASGGSTYTVMSGDSLWRIARSILAADGAPVSGSEISEFWRSIYDVNRDLIGSNPNLIHPGQVLQLPGR